MRKKFCGCIKYACCDCDKYQEMGDERVSEK